MKDLDKLNDSLVIGKHQLNILFLLSSSPRPLTLQNLYHTLNQGCTYFQIWRSLKQLKKKKLVERREDSYVITNLGFTEYQKRKNRIFDNLAKQFLKNISF